MWENVALNARNLLVDGGYLLLIEQSWPRK